MPPATASFFKQSRTKMQAWVTNNPGPGQSQPGVATSGPATIYQHPLQGQAQTELQLQPQPQAHPQAQTLTQTQTRHVNIPQPKPPTTTQQTSPGRSRSPIVNANSQRAATVAAVRIPMPVRSTHPYTLDEPVSPPRVRAISSEPLQQPKRLAPFWDESTAEESAFSDTAGNNDSNMPFEYHQLEAQGQPGLSYQQHEITRHQSVPRHVGRIDQPPPLIGSNGLIDMRGNGNGNGNGVTKRASTPDARSPRGGFQEINSDSGRDSSVDDSPYNTSPEKTPLGKRLQHPKALSLRPPGREPYSQQISYLNGDPTAILQSIRPHVYINPKHNEVTSEVPQAELGRLPASQAPEHQPRRSTIFADTDTALTRLQDESENANVIERGPTPMPAAKPAPKAKGQVNRQLFARSNKGKVNLRESAIPRSEPERRQPAAKKRSLELDYDDGALAAMDYSALRDEAFDFDPAQAEARSVFEPPRGTLPEKLDHFFVKDEVNQSNFFTQMPVKDWEEAGDWFLDRFGEIIDRFKEARKEKRNIIEAFENEIAGREEAVRNKIQSIGQTLTNLKNEGEGMMLGKELN
ncbi:extracellular mutant protein 11-domain-containing protein [Nemania sp. NC0429]|nr:extracellular mutant protein 11-domain-containing protein [Nemania sp. NC0429]